MIEIAHQDVNRLYRPVLFSRVGKMQKDDIGGIHGFAVFLEKYILDSKRYESRGESSKRELTFAKGLGWHEDKAFDSNLVR